MKIPSFDGVFFLSDNLQVDKYETALYILCNRLHIVAEMRQE